MTTESSVAPQSADPRYPIGKYAKPGEIDTETLESALLDLGELPQKLREAVDGLDGEQLRTPYRTGGWTVWQLVHHIADSHMNAYLRIKFALTEDEPTIKPYDENAWAALRDSEAAPVEWSLELLEALHGRLVMLLRSLTPKQWERGLIHPVNGRVTLATMATLYAWHSRHHVAHITALRATKGW